MSTDKPRFSVTMDEETLALVEGYREKEGLSTRNKAITALLQFGLNDIKKALSGSWTAKNAPPISDEAMEIAKGFEKLDDHGKEMVTLTLDCEVRRMEKAKVERAKAAPARPVKVIPLLGTSFAAGTTEPESDIPWEDLEVDSDSQAEFAIHINGNSMEPWLPDGSIAYGVKRRPTDGEVAALLLDGDFICKQVCQDVYGNLYLFALNRDRKDADQQIMHDTDRSLTCFGTIIMDRVPLPTDM